jgi:hypothetical protein
LVVVGVRGTEEGKAKEGERRRILKGIVLMGFLLFFRCFFCRGREVRAERMTNRRVA